MKMNCEFVSYDSTGHFTKLTTDYVNQHENLRLFYNYNVSLQGIKEAVDARKKGQVNRKLLVEELSKQYAGITLTQQQQDNLQSLLSPNTFTICTAHQPVIFTGPLYFIYKILHAIKLADILNQQLPESRFVPVFYMGSEDADLEELGHIFLNGEKLVWETTQTGAVGRMKVDKALLAIIDQMAGEIEVMPYGKELITLFRAAYKEGITIQQATLHLVNELFKDYGLLIVIPDNKALKNEFATVVRKELEEQFSHQLTEATAKQIAPHYKPQVQGREVNLFYLADNKRERIEKEGTGFVVKALKLQWTTDKMLEEASVNPEKFSANVVLRPLFQEIILPNVAFIGGGGEIAYWLELKAAFESAGVFFPMLVLRNSFLFVNETQEALINKLGFAINNFFKSSDLLLNELVMRKSDLQLSLDREKTQLQQWFAVVQSITAKIDPNLETHTKALQYQALAKIEKLEKKMLRAEKRKSAATKRQIEKLKQELFPNNSLQERTANFSAFYALYGSSFLQTIYDCSSGLGQQFGIVVLGKESC